MSYVTYDWNIDAVVGEIRSAEEDSLKEALDHGKDVAQGHTPVLTGALRDSIDTQPVQRDRDQAWGEIIAREPYAFFVEVGARGVPGRNMLRIGLDSAAARLVQLLEDKLR